MRPTNANTPPDTEGGGVSSDIETLTCSTRRDYQKCTVCGRKFSEPRYDGDWWSVLIPVGTTEPCESCGCDMVGPVEGSQ